MSGPSLVTIKALFAASCNRCAFPGCDLPLTSAAWTGVRADIAHIRGANPGSARFAPDMVEEDRHGLDNLLLLCPNHHREIDALAPQRWSAEELMEIKVDHERRCRTMWATEGELEQFASLLIAQSAVDSVEVEGASGARADRRDAAFIRAINAGTEVIASGGTIVDRLTAPPGFGGRRGRADTSAIDDAITRLSMAVDEVRVYGPDALVEILSNYFDLAVEIREVALAAGDVREVAQRMYEVKIEAYAARH